jgi:hypothetical protein
MTAHPVEIGLKKCLIAGVALLISGLAVCQTYLGPTVPVPPTYFGMHFHKLDSGTSWPRAAGVGSWRLWDARVIWPDIEAQRGQRDFSKLDRYMAMADLLKLDVVMGLGMTPTWASARPSEKAPYRPGATAEPREIADWEYFVTAVAKRYSGRIKSYDIWNEVNAGAGFFTGTPQAMLELQRTAYVRIKEIDPNAVVISPSSVGWSAHQLKWFEDYLALGAGRYADVISYHFYLPRERPEGMIILIGKVRDIMKRQGLAAKPLWNSESGYRVDLGQGDRAVATDPSWPKLDETTAAAYVVRALVIGWLSGLSRYYWYAWDNPEMGFLRPDGTLTQGATAYGKASRWLNGAVLERCENTKGLWRCDLSRNQAHAWLIWHESSTTDIEDVVLKGASCREPIDGPSETWKADSKVQAGPIPVLFTDCNSLWRR